MCPSLKMQRFALLLLLSISAVYTSDPDLYRCPDHLTNYVGQYLVKTYNGKCYEFFDDEKRWVDARQYCEEIASGGQLIEIPDAATMNWVKTELNLLPWRNNGVWNGANDRSDEGTWEWLSGVRLSDSFSYWASKQPNRGWWKGFNDCAVMKRGDGWRWRDVNCNLGIYTYKFICQFDMAPPTTSPTTSSTTSSTTYTTTNSTRSIARGPATSSTSRSTTSALVTPTGANIPVEANRSQSKSGSFSEAHLLGLVIGGILLLLILVILVAAFLFRSRRQKQQANSNTQVDCPLPAQPNPVYYECSSDSTFVSVSPFAEATPHLGGFSGVAPPPYLEKDPSSKHHAATDSMNLEAAGGHINPIYDMPKYMGQSVKGCATSLDSLNAQELANQSVAMDKANDDPRLASSDSHYDSLPPARPVQKK